jgi:hypothetical protein
MLSSKRLCMAPSLRASPPLYKRERERINIYMDGKDEMGIFNRLGEARR